MEKKRSVLARIFFPKPASHKKNSTWFLMKQGRQNYMMLAPYFILFFTFTVLPVLIAIFLSFTHFNMLQPPQWAGWGNYLRLFLEDEIFMVTLQNTLVIAIVAGPISYIACFTFAWIINELPPKLRAFMTLIFYAPSISGNVFFVWLWFFSGDRYGLLNGWLLNLAIIDAPINFLRNTTYMMPILLVVQVWLSLGVAFLAFIAGLQTIDKAMYEAGAMDGIRNRWQELWYITLPSMRPQLMFGAVMSITGAFSVGSLSEVLMGTPSVNYATDTIVTRMGDFGWIRFEMGMASAIAVILFLMMVGSNKAVQRLLRKVGTT